MLTITLDFDAAITWLAWTAGVWFTWALITSYIECRRTRNGTE